MKAERHKILAIDDESSSLNAINRTLRREYDLILASNGHSALEVLKSEQVSLILADQRMPEMTGIELFGKALELQPDAMRILITGYTDVAATIDAINQAQIFYYIHKPWEPEELRMIVNRALEQFELKRQNKQLLQQLQEKNLQLQDENQALHQEMERTYHFDNIIGESPAMNRVFDLMRKAIPSDVTVLIQGETGTGKELIARAIHYNGPRRDHLFVAQNCGALPDTLLESELFGHVKGSFTGAISDKKGLFELADQGTIFLDEVADTSLAMQQRLLRVLQEGEIQPVGSGKTRKVNVRVISAANRDLQEAIKNNQFRSDLYYRLNVFPIVLPPIRERREDIPGLANYFLKKYAAKSGRNVPGISADGISALMSSPFPGNVRQLENIIERAVILADEGEPLKASLLADSSFGDGQPNAQENFGGQAGQSLKEITESLERYHIARALENTRGNISKAAKDLGLSRLGLHKKLQRFGIIADTYKQR